MEKLVTLGGKESRESDIVKLTLVCNVGVDGE